MCLLCTPVKSIHRGVVSRLELSDLNDHTARVSINRPITGSARGGYRGGAMAPSGALREGPGGHYLAAGCHKKNLF